VLACNNISCKECLRDHINAELRKEKIRMECPHGCLQLIEGIKLHALMTPEQNTLLTRLNINLAQTTNKSLKNCPACFQAVFLPNENCNIGICPNPNCRKNCCFACQVKTSDGHKGISCADFKSKQD
jgi:hypothetical protein